MSLGLREVSGARKLLIGATSALALAGSLVAFTPLGGEYFNWFLMLPVVCLVLAAVAALLAPLPMQLFARAVQWSNLGLGVVLTILGTGRERAGGTYLAIGCGIALLAMGNRGLLEGERRAGFVPAAFRSSLLLLMVLALADAQSFALFGAARFKDGIFGPLMAAGALALAVGFVLLVRMSLAGLVLNVATCTILLVATFLLRDGFGELPTVVGALCVVHLLVAIPTALSVLRGKELMTLGPRLRGILATLVVVGLMAIATITTLLRSSS
jgi:hypothetical protein